MIKNLLCIFIVLTFCVNVQAQYVSSPVNADSRTLNTSYHVGSISGALTASSSGNSNYQIPIEVPSGVNGLVPNLSINYNSASSNGLLGYGVSLTGISFISRGANSYMQDGNSKKVDFNTSDALYLGGNRLILVSGTYGVANSEYRLDNSNRVRIKLYGSGTSIYFIVNMPNGRVYEYGSSTNSRLTGSLGTLRWYVKSISDNDGNSIQYGYIYDGNGFKISQILYAGNTIAFVYSSRDDKAGMYFAGTKLVQKEVLNKILVMGQGSIFREYQFSYFKNIYSYLNEIKVLGTDGTQLNSTVLNWGESNNHSKYSTAVSKNTHLREYGDFNGDGRIDFIQYPNKSSYTSSDTYQIFITSTDGKSETSIKTGALNSDFKSFQVLDYNGDHQDDILKMGYGAFGYSYYYWGYSSDSIITLASYFDDTRTAGSIKFIGADLNGDNIKNTIVLEKTLKWTLKRVDGVVATNFPSISSPTAEFFAHKFDNNNSEDIFIKSGDNLSVYELDPTDSKFKELYSASIFAGSTDYEFVDFNGDGIVDLLDNTNKKLYYGTGKGFYESTYPVVWDNSALIEKYRKVSTGDFNGDGLTDIYQVSIVKKREVYGTVNYSKVDVHYSTGEGFETKTRLDLRPFGSYDYTVSETLSAISIQDFNGDNLDDVICAYDASSKFQKILSNDSGNETYLTKLADGMNNKYAITYQRTNDGDIYSQDASTGDTNLSYYQGKMKMVKGISMASAAATISNTTYKYKNNTVHKNYGTLGCKEYTQLESVQDAVNTSVYEFIDEYYVGALKSSNSKLSDTLVSSLSSTNTVAKVNGSGNKGFSLISYTTAQSQTDHLRGITNSVTYSSFDNYYYPESISKNLGGGLTDNQAITYSHLVNSSYWILGRPTEVIDTKDHTDNASISTTSKWGYDSYQLETKTQLFGTPKEAQETYSYNSSGNVESVTLSGVEVENRTTSYLYDATNRFVTQETNALDHVSKATYDPVTGNQLTATDPNNRVTSFTYNGFGQLLTSNFADGTNQTNSLTWNSSITGITKSVYKASSTLSGRAPVSTYYDRLGRAIRSEGVGYNSKTIKTDTRYDSKGRVEAVSLPFSSSIAGETEYAYDTYGRPLTTTLPNGRGSISYTYNGLTTKVTNPESWKETTIDGAGFVKSVKDPGGEITYNYYSNGLVEDITFGQNIIHHTYDDMGNVTQTIDPDAGTTSAVYDAFGQMTSRTTANNQTYSLAYDKLGRITSRSLQSGGESTTWQYDPSNNKGAVHQILLNNQVQESFTYDPYGRPLTHTEKVYDGGVTESFISSYAYNSNGQLSRKTYPTGYYVDHTYSGDGLLTEIRDKNNKLIWNQAVTNDLGQFTSYNYGNGAVNSRTYDSYYQPDKINSKVGSRVLNDWDFNIDVKGNLTMRKDLLHSNQTENFTYDGLNRLTTSSNGSDVTYTSDNTGNLETKSDVGTYQYQHAIKKHAVTSIQNPYSTYQPAVESITYTKFNKVEEIEQSEGIDTKKMEFAYGADYLRKRSSLYENGTKKKSTYYTKNSYEVKIDHSSGVEKHMHYISAPSGAAAVFISSGGSTGDLYFVHTDYLGSIVALSNQTGYIAEEYAYDAWGNRRLASNWSQEDTRSNLLIDRGYTMHEHITGFGLVNMNGRVYDPKLGRFLSPDPVLQDASNTQNMNRYSYVLNNPLKYIDPSGYTNCAANYPSGSLFRRSTERQTREGGGGGYMYHRMGTIYNSDGTIRRAGPEFDKYVRGTTGKWVSPIDIDRDSKPVVRKGETIFAYSSDINGNYGFSVSSGVSFKFNANGSFHSSIGSIDISVAFSKGETWYYGVQNSNILKPGHAFVYNPNSGMIYEINHPSADPNVGPGSSEASSGLSGTQSGNVVSIGYSYDMTDRDQKSAFWEFRGGRSDVKLVPVNVPYPQRSISFFESFVGKSWDYSFFTNNCKNYVVSGLRIGGVNVIVSSPAPVVWNGVNIHNMGGVIDYNR